MRLLINLFDARSLATILAVIFMASFMVSCGGGGKEYAEEEATEEATDEVAEEEWIIMFDGESTEGWRGFGMEEMPARWQIVDGALHLPGSGMGEAGADDGGDILYDRQFENFHFMLEWKIQAGGNSGIFYLGQETEEYDYIWKTAPEMQVLHPEHKDWNLGTDGNRRAGSLYDLIAADPQNAKEAGEWNQVEIMVKDGKVTHMQNGVTVVQYELWTPEWEEMVAGSKFPGLNENWAQVAKKGYLGLQDHGDSVWYRNLKVKEL
jgi:hypothetical protein